MYRGLEPRSHQLEEADRERHETAREAWGINTREQITVKAYLIPVYPYLVGCTPESFIQHVAWPSIVDWERTMAGQ